MTTSKTIVNGLEIAYQRCGNGKALVLLHGYPLDHTIWHKVVPRLERDFDLILPDLAGFGESGILDGDVSLIGYARNLAGLLTHLNIRKAFVVGHSMGGYVALAFARQFPNMVLGLGLVSSQVLADTPETMERRNDTARQVLQEGTEVVAQAMVPKLSADPEIKAYTHKLISDQKPAGVAQALQAMAKRPDSMDIFLVFRFPVVVIHGLVDALIPVARGREMKAALPTAHYVELPRAGHMPMLEDPHAVADGLRFFIDLNPIGGRPKES